MRKGFLFLALIFFANFLVSGCAPAVFTPTKPPEVKFDPTPDYALDLSKLPKPDKIKPIFVDENFKEVPIEQAKYILLAPEEYAKIAALLKYAKAIKDISKEQETLINVYISEINALKELAATQQVIADLYRQLYADSENAYRQERHSHQMDNMINRGALGAVSIGSLLMLLLIL
jgi:hypothetical protein